MSNWCLHERTHLGGVEGREWILTPDKDLLVGTSSDCGVVIQTQGVDSSHALFKWDQKNLSYVVKDLNTSNGTFVNNHPLRGTSILLKHNDAIRFGMDKDHVFRMEECFRSSESHSAAKAKHPVAMSSTVASSPPPSSPQHNKQARIQHALPISPTDGDESSLHRSDGRRMVDVEHSPALNKASKLYGQPGWWGQDVSGRDGAEARNREFEFAKPGSQILRDLEPEQPKLPLKADELRMQAIPNSRLDPASSWVVDFGNATGTSPKVRRPRERGSRPRSADPSPNRVSARRDPSPLPKRAVTPVQYKRHSSLSTPSSQATVTPKRQRAATPPVSRPKGPSLKKPPVKTPLSPKRKPLGKTPQSTTTRSKTPLAAPQPKSQVCSTESPNTEPAQVQISIPVPISDSSIDLKSLNEGPLSHLVKTNENTYTACSASSGDSASSLSDQSEQQYPVVVTGAAPGEEAGRCENGKEEARVEGEGKESPANRKQWTEGEAQNLDSLMMASIEARMRKLSKLAHQTARQVTSLKNTIRDGHQMEVKGMDYLSLRDASPVVTRPEQNLPEWKSFNHEANSIFRNMRVVEKWLQDIDGTLNSIQAVDRTTTSVAGDYTDLASDGELYLDTVDMFESTSDGD